ncbi:hypothetical protein H9Q70_002964 [Fusarium xylarioides]|nr:hypothetical protein H9Q70_002964 [Fusarium xylarioides]
MPHAVSSISYDPDHSLFSARAKALMAKTPSKHSIPDNFPTEAESAMVWHGGSFEADHPETFHLPTLGPFIRDIVAMDIYHGKGFAVLRGIPVHKYSDQENTIIHVGLASWLGRLRGRQDKLGNLVIRHIKDVTSTGTGIPIGTAQYTLTTTADSQAFHTDFGDIVSLYCIDTSASGGTSHLASLGQIYNDLYECRPDVIGVLAGDWPFATFEKQAITQRPALFYHRGRLAMQYSRRLFTGFGDFRNDEVSRALTMAHMDAMDNLEFLARKNSISMNLQRGDVQWVNNLGILHSRDAFQDNDIHRRELQRIWVRNEEMAWDLPKALDGLWNRIFYSMELHQQEFAPIESRIKTRGPGGKTGNFHDNLQGNEWTGEQKAPERYTFLKGETGNVKFEGQEWAETAQSLGESQWPSRDEINSRAGNLDGDEWNELVGGEWAESLRVSEVVEDLKGYEWTTKSGQQKSTRNLEGNDDESLSTILGNEWAGGMKGSEWSGHRQKAEGVVGHFKDAERTCALEGNEWTAKDIKSSPSPHASGAVGMGTLNSDE